MSGPIVRSGASPQFSKNWESIFGKKTKASTSQAEKSKSPKKKAAKKKAAKKAKKSPTNHRCPLGPRSDTDRGLRLHALRRARRTSARLASTV